MGGEVCSANGMSSGRIRLWVDVNQGEGMYGRFMNGLTRRASQRRLSVKFALERHGPGAPDADRRAFPKGCQSMSLNTTALNLDLKGGILGRPISEMMAF